MKINKKKGFTLIELIIVIAIIAILAAIAIPKFGEVRKNANIKSDIANAKTIANATTALLAEGEIEPDYYILGKNDAADSTDIEEYLQSVPRPKSVSINGFFAVRVNTDGSVKVIAVGEDAETGKEAGKEFFPEQNVDVEAIE